MEEIGQHEWQYPAVDGAHWDLNHSGENEDIQTERRGNQAHLHAAHHYHAKPYRVKPQGLDYGEDKGEGEENTGKDIPETAED